MTPYTDRRQAGYYNPDGDPPANTTTDNLAGLVGVASHEPEAESTPVDEVVEEPTADPELGSEATDLDDLTKAELLDRARAQGISPANASMSKGELRAALEANS